MIFKTTLDKLTKGITLAAAILLLLIIALQLGLVMQASKTLAIVLSAFILAVFLMAYLFRPLYYELTGSELIIHRPIKDVKIVRQNILRAEPVDKKQLKGTIRLFGVGGFFGYYGKFTNSRFGSMTWYATRKDNTILLTTGDKKKILLTPDEPELFIQELSDTNLK